MVLLSAQVRGEGDLTLDWILDPANLRALQTAQFLWLPDDSLLLDDPRRPEGERALERLDPASLERRPAAGAAAILESWKSMTGDGAPKRLGLPLSVSPKGALLYARGGDLFVAWLDPPSPGKPLVRITNTEADEGSARFSPDGSFVSYVRENDIHVAEVATGRERRLTRDGAPSRLNGTPSWVYWEEILNRRDDAHWWSSDSKRILYLQTDESTVEPFPLAAFEPPTPNVRWQRYPKAGAVNPRARAGIAGVEGDRAGETVWVDLGPDPPEYIARVAWLPDGSGAALVTLNRAQNRCEIHVADAVTGKTRRIHEESSSTWINLHDELAFLPGGERYLWLSERKGFRDLFVQSASGGDSLQLTSGPWGTRAVHGSRGARVVGKIDASRGKVIFHAARDASTETHIYAVGLDGSGLARLSEGPGTHTANVSPGGRWYVEEHSRAGLPPRLTLHRDDGTLVHVISPAATERLERFGLEQGGIFEIPSGEARLPARLLRPVPFAEGRRYPAIVFVYGGPGAPTVEDRWEGPSGLWMHLLARKGFATLAVDPRSASDRGKALEDLAHRNFYGDREIEDITAAVSHLKSLSFIDPDRIGIWGWSGGGTTTLQAMTRTKEFRAGIAVAGVTDWRLYDTVYTERYMKAPSENADGYAKSSPVQSAGDLHGRLLLVHGTADDNVHAQNALVFMNALIEKGKQFDLMLYPGRDHGIGDPAARKHLFQLMLAFWERELRG